MKIDYHSALSSHKEYKTHKCERYVGDNITAFVYDIESTEIPEMFYEADFIYAELPWKHGYKIFNKRAGKENNSWNQLIENSIELAKKLGKPYYFTGGKEFARFFPEYTDREYYWDIHNCNTRIYTNKPIQKQVKDVKSYIRELYNNYDLGLDFCCGYGYLGRFAKELGKQAILTDINPYCIGYIEITFPQL